MVKFRQPPKQRNGRVGGVWWVRFLPIKVSPKKVQGLKVTNLEIEEFGFGNPLRHIVSECALTIGN